MKLGAKLGELLQLMQKFVPQSHVGFFATNGPSPTIGPKTNVSVHFVVFGCIWDRFRDCMKLVAKHIKLVQLIQKFMPESHVVIFRTNAPDPPHWTITSCFGVFHSIWVHLGLFRNCLKLDAKWGKLEQVMQNLVPRSHVGSLLNDRTQSTPLDPKLMFLCIS